MKAANLALAFALELLMLAALGYWAFAIMDGGWQGAVAAIVLIGAAISLWAIWAAPTSSRRLKLPGLLVFKIAIFAAATLGLWVAGQPAWALVLGVLAAVNLSMASVWDQQ